ncbi:MAG: hypothetical protein RL720_640 [Actinomycetota bacterium]|jgi:RimJ/RimL family protein N-acetyltransferase
MFSLRDLELGDNSWITEAVRDPEIQRWTASGGISQDDLKNWVILKGEDPAGLIALHAIDEPTSTADVGYWIAPWARRQGAATAALTLIQEELRNTPGVRSIQLSIMDSNEPSLALARTLGFEEKASGTCSCGTQGEVSAVIFEKTL